jgi:acetylornithine deacetylase
MYVFHHHFSIPAVLWGPRGANTHLADEYVELDTVVDAAKALLLFTCRWCSADPLNLPL